MIQKTQVLRRTHKSSATLMATAPVVAPALAAAAGHLVTALVHRPALQATAKLLSNQLQHIVYQPRASPGAHTGRKGIC